MVAIVTKTGVQWPFSITLKVFFCDDAPLHLKISLTTRVSFDVKNSRK